MTIKLSEEMHKLLDKKTEELDDNILSELMIENEGSKKYQSSSKLTQQTSKTEPSGVRQINRKQ